jgi:hypothetical protein
MKNVTAMLMFGGVLAVAPAVARADDNQPQILQSSAGARSGADRLGGINMTAPAHASTGTGQSPEALSTDDTRKEQPRNPAVVGPPVPRPPKQSSATNVAPPNEQPTVRSPTYQSPDQSSDQPSDQPSTEHN